MDESVSKSQKKRDAVFLQKIGVELLELSSSNLDTLPLGQALRQAIDTAKRLTSHGAQRRQAQLIGRLMRESDHESIIQAYNELKLESNAQNAHFHALEQWRERLMAEGKIALTEFVEQYPDVDVQQLRQLIKKAVEEKNQDKSTGAAKALFRFLRKLK